MFPVNFPPAPPALSSACRISAVVSITRAMSCLVVAKAVEYTDTLLMDTLLVSVAVLPDPHSCKHRVSMPHTFGVVRYCVATESDTKKFAN